MLKGNDLQAGLRAAGWQALVRASVRYKESLWRWLRQRGASASQGFGVTLVLAIHA